MQVQTKIRKTFNHACVDVNNTLTAIDSKGSQPYAQINYSLPLK